MDEQRERACTRCGEAKPAAAFGRDARRKDGLRSECRECLRGLQRERRSPGRPRPGALVLVPAFPAPPLEPVAAAPAPLGHYASEAERFLAALEPPAGDADALLVHSLRGLAELADLAMFGVDRVRDVNTCVTGMIRVQRELAATRATKAAAPAAAPKTKLGRFAAG